MVDLAYRDADRIFNFFLIYENDTGNAKYVFPDSTGVEFVNRVIEFGPACCRQLNFCEYYVLLFTDGEGRCEYVHCLQNTEEHFFCFSSYLPWFDCFHRLLEEVKSKELYKPQWIPTLNQFLDKLREMKPPPSRKNAISIPYPIPNAPDQDIRLPIPTPSHPYYLKAFEQYYSSLEPLQWIDIFISMLLEKSILFYSKSRQRLTYSIIAAVSLLYPLSWVSPIYPVLSRKFLQVLESPVPFIAGIHSCMFETAKPYITYGTRVVDLDGQRILVNMPDADLDREDVPAAILEFFGVEFSDSKRFLKSAMNSKSNEFAPWKTSKLPMQNYLAQRAKPFFAILVNLLGYFRQCTSPSGQVDFRKMVACQACPPLEPFLVQLYESQMIHCFLYDRLSTHTADDFEIQAHLLSDKCRERLQHNPSNKPNFGDLRWISCKRSMTSNSRFRRKLGQQWSKLTSKAAVKANQLKLDQSTAKLWEKVSTDGIPGPPAITYSRSMGPTENPGSGRLAASNDSETPDITFRYSSPPHRPPRHHSVHPRLPSSSLNHDRTPTPVESFLPPRPVPFDGGVSETPITPTTVWPRPSIPPKTFFLAKDRNPPPIPAKSFQRAPTLPKPRGVNNQATPPPALPPRRLPVLQSPKTQTPVTLPASSLASSVQRISSTPELLDDLGSDGSSASMKTMESAECSIEGFTLLGLHPPLGVSHSDESITPLYGTYSRESAI